MGQAFRDGLTAIRRRWRPLSLVLLANVVVTAGLSAAQGAGLKDFGPWPMAGEIALQFGFILVDATLGVMALVLALDAFSGAESLSLPQAWRRSLSVFWPALVVVALDASTSLAYPLLQGVMANGGVVSLRAYDTVELTDFLLNMAMRCTISYAAFAALGGARSIPAALAGSLRLTRRARWKLLLLAFVIFFADRLASVLTSLVGGLLASDGPDALREAIGQSLYTTWFILLVVLQAGICLGLQRVAATREPDLLAAQFD